MTAQPSLTIHSILVPEQMVSVRVRPDQSEAPLQLELDIKKGSTGNESPEAGITTVWIEVAAGVRDAKAQLVQEAKVRVEAIIEYAGLDSDQLSLQLNRILPARLFATARLAVDSLTRSTGYQALVLPPVQWEGD